MFLTVGVNFGYQIDQTNWRSKVVTTDLLGYIVVFNATFNNIKGKSCWTCFKISFETHNKMRVMAN
jgi:hypothetical protein